MADIKELAAELIQTTSHPMSFRKELMREQYYLFRKPISFADENFHMERHKHAKTEAQFRKEVAKRRKNKRNKLNKRK